MPLVRSGMYFNEWEPFQCRWLRRLYPSAIVDSRDICSVTPDDVIRYRQVHLFAGIGGWEYALRLAGWPDDLSVWSGSCPCQPFSICGSRKGVNDERHLWPVMFRLIRECHPTTVFGEQVSGSAGRDWITRVRSDLEGIGYAIGIADMSSGGVSAPHNRKRLYWVAYSTRAARIRTVMRGYERSYRGVIDGMGYWDDYENIRCPGDGKKRRIEPGLLPVANGVSERVGRISAFGNAIVPQLAAVFIKAFMHVVL